ncbi:G-protein coupled receptor 161-like [Saccostrea echinata]|uniref:G-protein coupled receptor 161-like n=1 Tax=Saccostrea echinata TaxID=191078 RepID=UPI002A7EEF9C|nr:G-protein coupled receptor 161-like [Saccostrea echinata]
MSVILRRLLSSSTLMCNGTNSDCSSEPNVGLALMALIVGVILALSLAMNSVVCLVFYKKTYLLSVSNSFVLNLSCCQLCLSVLVAPFVLASIFSTKWAFDDTFCKVQGYFFTICIIAIQFSLMIISIDRNYAIINSLRYPYVFTPKLGHFLIASAWILSVIIALPPLVGWGSYIYIPDQYLCGINWKSGKQFLLFLVVVCFLIPLLVQSWCYLSIFKAAIGQTKRRSRVYPSMPSTVRDPPSNSSDSSDLSQSVQVQYRNVECKAVRTILLIAFAYALCWVPFLTIIISHLRDDAFTSEVNSFAICLVFCTGIVNPIIYAFMNRVTRHEINKFFCDTINKGNGRTTTGNDSDDFYSTTMTTYSSSKQNVVVWTTQKMRSKHPAACNIEMNTIQEVREVSTSSSPNSERKEVEKRTILQKTEELPKLSPNSLSIPGASQVNMLSSSESSTYSERSPGQQHKSRFLLSVSRDTTPQTSPKESRQRISRAQSEFLSRGETFLTKTQKDCGSFLSFEGKHKEVHVHRKRSNSHYQDSSKQSAYTTSPTFKRVTDLRRISEEYPPREIFFSDPSLTEVPEKSVLYEGRERAMTISESRVARDYFKNIDDRKVSEKDTKSNHA